MPRRTLFVSLALAALLAVAGSASAQTGPEGQSQVPSVVNELTSPNPNFVHALSVVLVFGTGLLAALFWGLSKVITAFRSDVGNASAIRAEVASLADRVEALERSMGSPVGVGDQSGRSL